MLSSKQRRPSPVTIFVLFLAAVGCSPTAGPGLSHVVDAALDATVRVVELRVNEGPPPGS